MIAALESPHAPVAHLEPQLWAQVHRHFAAKAIAELSHELLLEPESLGSQDGVDRWALRPEGGAAQYEFSARRLRLDHWAIDPASLRRVENGRQTPVDVLQLMTELRPQLGIPLEAFPDYLDDLTCTLNAAAYRHARRNPSAPALAAGDFQEIEAAMIAGHPCFIANGGRLGFSALDHGRYAPEAAAPLHLTWLAAKRKRVNVACVEGLTYERLLAEELPAQERDVFSGELARKKLDPSEFTFIPVHPWQWENRLAQLFAPDLAAGDLVHLGAGRDLYLPQQSIRTLFNISADAKHSVKTSLSIVNMGFTRGMSPSIAAKAVAANDWVSALVQGDRYLQANGFSLLREVAFVGYRNRCYEAASSRRVEPYKELLAACWRENPVPRLAPGQRLMTMAALLHVDRSGEALLPALIRASGLRPEVWVTQYLRSYFTPLVHCFYAHQLTFTPHFENTLLVLEGSVPVRILLKDLAEDIGVLNPESPLPPAVAHLALKVPENVMTLALFTDVFDCVFRFVAHLLDERGVMREQTFWGLVGDCVRDYQASQPHLAAKFRRYDLFAPSFARNCLNRLQLRNHRMMVDLNAAEPVESLQFAGTLDNPIAPPEAA